MAKKEKVNFVKMPSTGTPPSRFPVTSSHFHNDSDQPKTTGIRNKLINVSNNEIILRDSNNDRVAIKDFGSGDVGVRIFDSSGNLVFDVTSGNAKISNLLTVGTDERIEIDGNNQRILMKDTAGDNRISLDSNAGTFKLSQAGKDVTTANDDELIWSSDFNAFKIVDTVTGTISGQNNSATSLWKVDTDTIAHGLSYIPTVFCFTDGDGSGSFGGQRRLCPTGVVWLGAGANSPWVGRLEAMADATNVYIRFLTAPLTNLASRTVGYRYYLMREIANN